MAEQPPPTDYFVTSFQFTKTVYRDQYPSVDPTRPELSQKGKVAIITGASQGIGKAIALGFAKASAAGLVLVGRNGDNLKKTKAEIQQISASTNVLCVPINVTSKENADKLEAAVRAEFSSVDVLINGAGQWLGRGPIGKASIDDWWGDFEVNIKGNYLMTSAFLSLLGDKKGHIVNLSSFGSDLVYPTCSSYALTKTSINRFTEYTAAEYPKVTCVAYHPGSCPTAILDLYPDFGHFAYDTFELAAGVAVYLSSERVDFLNGRYISCNWSVDELEERKEEIVSKDLLKLGIKGEFGAQQFK